MEQNRSRRRVADKDFDVHEVLSQVTILHHTDAELARKITRAVLLKRVARSDFREPILELQSTDGVIHVSI